jgi:hypothetical protein
MKKHLLILASLVFGIGQLFADTVTFLFSDLAASLPEGGKMVNVPYTWTVNPGHVSVTIAKLDGTEGTMKIAATQNLKGYTLTVTVAGEEGKLNNVEFTGTPATLGNATVNTGTYTSGTWESSEGTKSVTFTTNNNFTIKKFEVDYTPDPDFTPDVPVIKTPKVKIVANAAHYYGGTEPFVKDVLNGEIYAYNNKGQYEKWGNMDEVDDLATTTTYEGKLVILKEDNSEYKYVDGAWKKIGDLRPTEIADTKYQNMNNWTCRFGYGTTFDNIENEGNNNFFNPYKGEGGWEPYQCKVEGLTVGETYRVSFNFTSDGWTSWNNDRWAALPVFVTNNWDFPQNDFYPTAVGGEILGFTTLPKTAQNNAPHSFTFVADATETTLAVNFGVVDDAPQYLFHFDNIKIESVPVLEEYDSSIFEIDETDNHTYSPLAYIESTGAIRENPFTLPYIPVTATQLQTAFNVYDTSDGWCAIFCGRNTYAGTGISLYMNGNKQNFGYFTGGTTGGGDNFAPFSVNTDYEVTADVTKLVVNGIEYPTDQTETKSTTRALSLFANPEWDNPMRGRINYMTIKEGDNIIYDFKPVMRNDGAFGYYDANSKLFVQPLQNYNGYKFALSEDGSYIIFPNENRTLFVGFTAKYEPTVQNMATPSFTWTSSNENVATVAADGTVTGIARGTTIITATDANSKWIASYELKVEPAVVAADNIEVWDGSNDAIVGSIRWSGEEYKPAYTMTFDSGMGYNESYYNHIYGVPAADENGNAWYETDFQMINVPDAVWSYNNNILPNGWSGNMGEVYVRRYFKAEGELPAQLYMPAPHDDAPCEYYINGTLVWSRTGYEPGVDGWYEGEVVKLTAEQRALIKTDGSVNVFAYHVHQNWGGRYADGGIYGNSMAENSPSKAFEGNENRKRLASALAQAEGVEGIDADVLAYAKNANVCLQDAGRALSLIRWELRKALSPRHNYTFASAEPADGLECWLYNVGAGQFLAGGNDWGTHTSLNYNISSWPMILRANSSGENRFAIQTNLPNGRRGGNDGLGHNGYVDCGYGDDFTTNEGWAWTFEAVGNGNYRIIQSGREGEEGKYLGMTEDERYQVDTDKAGADNLYNQWKVVTREQLDALAAAATPENPADVSYFIHQNTFSQNDFDGNDKGAANGELNDSKWERNAGSIWNWKNNDANGDYVFEMWNTAEVGKVYLKQTIEGLPAGKYIVECTGFYRDGNWDDAIAGNTRQLAYIYAGSEENKTLLPNIMEGANKGAGYGRLDSDQVITDGCAQAPRFFRLGTYTVQAPVVNVGAAGTLEIGIYRDAEDVKEKDWIVVDNFRLYRVGATTAETVTIGEALYATYVAPVDVDFTGTEVSAFAAQAMDGYVHLEPVTTVPAGTAVVVKADAAGTYDVNTTTGASLGATNELIAATADVTADGTQYILAKQDDEVGFAKATTGSTIAAGKGYLQFTTAVKAFYPFAGNDATGISGIEAINGDAPIYNIAGQRLGKMQKGINIVGGKKVLK